MSLLALLNVKNLQAKSSALRIVNSNLNFAVELMSREIRTGKDYCSCASLDIFQFTNSDGAQVTYRYRSAGQKITRQMSGGTELDITSPQVQVLNVRFFKRGQASGDQQQPRVTIIINAITSGGKAELRAKMNVQTTISQREVVS